MRQAIREYAPGSEIVADKRIWRSDRPIFWKDIAKVLQYRICDNCHNLELSREAGIELTKNTGTCEICGQTLGTNSKIRSFVEPDGFLADQKSGTPAKQYVNIEPSQMRSALLPEKHHEASYQNSLYSLTYNRTGKLLYVNEGNYGRGFKFSLKGFSFFEENEDKKCLSLGHIQMTDTLHITFKTNEYLPIPSPRDDSFWLSLMYAILNGASHGLQIERRDIDGVLSPIKDGTSWQQTIVLFDNCTRWSRVC